LYGKRVEELKAGIRNLKKARDEVQQKVEEEDNRYGKRISKEVEDWIDKVNEIITESEKFNEEEDDHQLAVVDLLESGYLPKYGIRYCRIME
jgi:seryl-tRNA synthetase